jgi:transcriptional regulator with XRE-family HTH domain
VAGLRRDEVAQLAGISIEYYTRLERGNIRGVSHEVLEGLAQALQLDDVETAHLIDLVRMANASPAACRRPTQQQVRPSVQRLLDSMTNTAAFVRNGRLDTLAANPLRLRAVLAGVSARRPPVTRGGRPTWSGSSSSTTSPRGSTATGTASPTPPSAACAPAPAETRNDRMLTSLVGELSMRSQEFRERWAAHDGEYYRNGVQPFRHPLVGDLDLEYDALEIPGRSRAAHHRLQRRAGLGRAGRARHPRQWAATHHPADQPDEARAADGHAPA